MRTEFEREYLKERSHLEDLGIDGRRILKWILKKENGSVWTELMWLRTGTMAGCFENGNESVGSIKCGEFLD